MVPVGGDEGDRRIRVAVGRLIIGALALGLMAFSSGQPKVNGRPETKQAAPHHTQQGSQALPPREHIAAPTNVGTGIASQNPAAQDTKAKAEDEKKGVELGSWPDWVMVVFTLALTVVAVMQNRLETKLAEDTKDSLAIAKQSADAALAAADAAQAALIAQNPPKLIVRRLGVAGLARGRPIEIHGVVANIGGSPATIIESDFTVEILTGDRLPAEPPLKHVQSPIAGEVRPGPGVQFKAAAIFALTQEEFEAIIDPDAIGLMLVGYISYRDQRGVDRYMSFGRRYDADAHRFKAVDDENYEYSQ